MRRQVAWNMAAHAIGQLLPPLLVIVLARLLTPADFGIFALVSIIIAFMQAVGQAPFGEAIVQSRQDDIGDFMFTVQLLLATVLAVILFLAAPLLAVLFSRPELAFPLRVSSLLILLTPLADTSLRMSMRIIAFQAVFARRLVSPVANALVSIPLALSGFGFWALIWGQLAGTLLATLAVLILSGWRPRLNFDHGRFRADLWFSLQMAVQNVMRWARSQSDRAILGMHVDNGLLGQYEMSRRLASMPFVLLVDPLAQVMYAVLSDRLRQGNDIRALFLAVQRRMLLLAVPAALMLALNAQEIVLLLLGRQWAGMAPAFRIFALLGAFYAMVGINTEIFKAGGRPGVMTAFMLVRGGATVVAILFLAPHGVLAVAWGFLGLAMIFSPLNVWLVLRLLKIPFGQYAHAVLLRPFVLAMAVGLCGLALRQLSLPMIAELLVQFFGAAIFMLGGLWLWEPDIFSWRKRNA